MKVFPATAVGIAIIAALRPLGLSFLISIAPSRRAARAAATRTEWPPFPRMSIAMAELDTIGEPPSAASNMRLKVEKLAKVGEANVEFIASRSVEVPFGLYGASELELPLQPARVSETSPTARTDRFANCSTRMGSASILGSS